MIKKINEILKQVLQDVKPTEEEISEIKSSLEKVSSLIKKRLSMLKVDAEIFVGGSFAKNTLIKKDHYDIDIFIRFSKEYKEELSILLKKILDGMKNVSLIHGSRDYFRISISPTLYLEIIPVLKITNPKEAENITDLTYSHVNYVNKKTDKKLLDDIRIAKAFCYAAHCYGAESYINGFSGYSLELLIIYYGSFLNFIKSVSKTKEDKIIIDIEKHYRNKQHILMDLNSSKLNSPIILIDPTYKKRNALAALSDETFEKFKKECIQFLKNPSIKSFEIKKTDLEKIKKEAKNKNHEFILIEAKTLKQPGDIAGSKLLKFYNHLSGEIEKFFIIKDKGFNYNEKKSARCFFVVESKGEITISGPLFNDKMNVRQFKKKHKNTYEKKGKVYAREKISFSIKKFIEDWKKKNKKKTQEMYISELKVIE